MHTFNFSYLIFFKLALLFVVSSCGDSEKNKANDLGKPSQLKSTEDWQEIVKRRKLRVLVSPNRSNFFISKDSVKGFEFEMFQSLESYMRNYSNLIDFQIEYIPVSHDELLPMLNKGHGDVAAAMLTISNERKKIVDFTKPYLKNIKEILPEFRKIFFSNNKNYNSFLFDFSLKVFLSKQVSKEEIPKEFSTYKIQSFTNFILQWSNHYL